MDKRDALESLSVPAYILTQLQAKGKSKISITKCISVGIFSHMSSYVVLTSFLFPFFSEVPVSELSLELLLLQVVLPALLEQGHTRQWLKNVMHGWAVAAAFVL